MQKKFTGVTALLIAILLVVTDVIFNRITSINKRFGPLISWDDISNNNLFIIINKDPEQN